MDYLIEEALAYYRTNDLFKASVTLSSILSESRTTDIKTVIEKFGNEFEKGNPTKKEKEDFSVYLAHLKHRLEIDDEIGYHQQCQNMRRPSLLNTPGLD